MHLDILLLGAALAVTVSPTVAQDSEPPAATPAAAKQPVRAEALRSRIHDMRMNLLLGGDQVRRAEDEAVQFYSQKAALVDDRLDTIHVELSEKRASYDVTLARALDAKDANRRREAMGDAGRLRAETTALEAEAADLARKREGLGQLVSAVESRDRDRERLVAQLETGPGFEYELGMPMTSIGLAPVAEPVAASSPFDDDALVEDLLERDPRGARGLLYEMDPVRYWQRFPLRPPAPVLARALPFPLPDLPRKR